MIVLSTKDTEALCLLLMEYCFIDNPIMAKEIIEEEEDYDRNDGNNYSFLTQLMGYEMGYTTVGNHKNDSQIVEYTFTFKSPTGEMTKLETDMSLMMGFQFYKELQIK